MWAHFARGITARCLADVMGCKAAVGFTVDARFEAVGMGVNRHLAAWQAGALVTESVVTLLLP